MCVCVVRLARHGSPSETLTVLHEQGHVLVRLGLEDRVATADADVGPAAVLRDVAGGARSGGEGGREGGRGGGRKKRGVRRGGWRREEGGGRREEGSLADTLSLAHLPHLLLVLLRSHPSKEGLAGREGVPVDGPRAHCGWERGWRRAREV